MGALGQHCAAAIDDVGQGTDRDRHDQCRSERQQAMRSMGFPGDVSKADREGHAKCADVASEVVVGAIEAPTDQRDDVLGKQHDRDPGHCWP